MRKFEPEWTPEQILKIRQIYRKGDPLEEVIKMTGSSLGADAVRRRAMKLGMKFVSVPRTRNKTSLIVKVKPEGNKHA